MIGWFEGKAKLSNLTFDRFQKKMHSRGIIYLKSSDNLNLMLLFDSHQLLMRFTKLYSSLNSKKIPPQMFLLTRVGL